MKILRYGEKVTAAGASSSVPATESSCSIPDCVQSVQFYVEFRGSSKRRVELCGTHMQEARASDIEFDRQVREFFPSPEPKSATSGS